MSKMVAIILDEESIRKADADAIAIARRLGGRPSRSLAIREAIRSFFVAEWKAELSTEAETSERPTDAQPA